MIIRAISNHLLQARDISDVWHKLLDGKDATLSISQSARTLIVASVWAEIPRACLYVTAGEETASLQVRALQGLLGADKVFHFAERRDLPWSERVESAEIIAQRTRALYQLQQNTPCVVVASARALMRRLPPVSSHYLVPLRVSIADTLAPKEFVSKLAQMGYVSCGSIAEVRCAGTYYAKGDFVCVYALALQTAVRVEFFGDEVDAIRVLLSTSGQSIGEIETLELFSCREAQLTPKTIAHAKSELYERAQEDTSVAEELELIERGAYTAQTDAHLVDLYGTTASPIEYLSPETLVVLGEPRALFDDFQHAYDEIEHTALEARATIEGLFTPPQTFDFGAQQRLSLSSLTQVGTNPTARITIEQPHIAGGQAKLITRVKELLARDMHVVFASSHRDVTRALELEFVDAQIPFVHADNPDKLPAHKVALVDDAVSAGVVIPSARLAVLSAQDMNVHVQHGHRRMQKVDPTRLSFPFKPGDYVVHATHGIALFKEIVRQEVGGKKRDYFLLVYAHDDKLFVPFEQADRLTRYIGPDGSTPRLTRLNCADWSRATTRARASAKKLAFDLVDLYTRRQTCVGYQFSEDTSAQIDMEESFPYELTRDQAQAIADIKHDMQSKKPMDRLLCGDVGFGKTEVALRAAFKCCQDGKQVMVLCPTTILAQQHFETFFERFSPFDIRVCALSRFVSQKQQKRALEGFASGEVKVLIGTHRLLSSDVNPRNLGLVIIDEEQRFGVQHKEQLKNIREQIDVLTLSATPIPRTMQMAMSGVRDISLILSAPAGRKPVKVHVGEWDKDVVSDAIRSELARGGQVYYVSNRVATIDEARARVEEAAPEARIGVAHGQMSASAIEDVMLSFVEHEIDVLVATTIIESGIDNPHTNTLIIEDAERLGLAQLYQLKGRVGRGKEQAYAYFMFPEDKPLTHEAEERLYAIYEHQELGSGLRIAMKDLEIRGAGSLVGAEQHGNLSSVGFDLFCQMLKEAVEEVQGHVAEGDASDVVINIAEEFYISEDYIPEVDVRVLYYRKLAYAQEIEDIDSIEAEMKKDYGDIDEAAEHLFLRARIRIYANELKISSVSVSAGKLTMLGLDVPYKLAQSLRQQKTLYFPKTKKLTKALESKEHLKEVCDFLEYLVGVTRGND